MGPRINFCSWNLLDVCAACEPREPMGLEGGTGGGGAELLAYLGTPGTAAPMWKIFPVTHGLQKPEHSNAVGPLQAPNGSLSLSPAPGVVAAPQSLEATFHLSIDLSLLSLSALAFSLVLGFLLRDWALVPNSPLPPVVADQTGNMRRWNANS